MPKQQRSPIETVVFKVKEEERQFARVAGEVFYFTGRPCKYGHIAQRNTKSRQCVVCEREKCKRHYHNNLDEKRAYHRDWARGWRIKNPEASAARSTKTRLKQYGLTPESYADIWNYQNGKCATCSTPLTHDRFTHVDHCHETGNVRGILCHPCNITLGMVKDDPVVLRSLAFYIEQHRS